MGRTRSAFATRAYVSMGFPICLRVFWVSVGFVGFDFDVLIVICDARVCARC